MTGERLLSVSANVTVSIGDQQLTVRGDGSRVTVEAPSLRGVFRVFRGFDGWSTAQTRLRALASLLNDVGLAVTLRTPRRKVLSFGYGHGSRLLCRFGLPNTTLHVRG